jgi:precorrin-6B C5,15-methyltransferase / cobalt-precorrin-6B C5,C15-methyltransferase
MLAGGRRLLDFYPNQGGGRLILEGSLDDWLDRLAEAAETKRVVVLASGDPNFFGIGRRVVDRVGPANVRIHANVTAVQAAFARLKESWAGVTVISLHGRSEEILFSELQTAERLAVYTDPVNTPARIARIMIDRGQTGWRMCVLENLGQPDIRVSYHRLPDVVDMVFSDLNVVVLWRKNDREPLYLGMPDDAFDHEAGLITKSELRAVVLSRLALRPGLTLWDLGAGCGSVGIEATILVPGGNVIAVERQADRVRQIESNRARFGCARLTVIQGELPGIIPDLPLPDRIFIGGGGPQLEAIIRAGLPRLANNGVVVAAVVKLDSLNRVRLVMEDLRLDPDIVQVQVSRGEPLAGDVYLKALNPVYVVRGRKINRWEK